MKRIIYNNVIPFKGFMAITIWPFIFVRSHFEGRIRDGDIRHETIHLRQQAEMLVLPFYLWYIAEWLFRLCAKAVGSKKDPYRSILFEQEAYDNEDNPKYLSTRRHYAWLRYLKK